MLAYRCGTVAEIREAVSKALAKDGALVDRGWAGLLEMRLMDVLRLVTQERSAVTVSIVEPGHVTLESCVRLERLRGSALNAKWPGSSQEAVYWVLTPDWHWMAFVAGSAQPLESWLASNSVAAGVEVAP